MPFPQYRFSHLNKPQILWIIFPLNFTINFLVTSHITFPKLFQRLIRPVNLHIIFISELILLLLHRGVLFKVAQDGKAALDGQDFWVELFAVWSEQWVIGRGHE